jgi:hypothetical protein
MVQGGVRFPALFLNNSNMKTKQIVYAYVNAINSGIWDYPNGHKFNSNSEIYKLVCEGKTIYQFGREAAIHYGTMTGALMAFGGIGYTSQSTRKAIRNAVLYAQKITQINNQ